MLQSKVVVLCKRECLAHGATNYHLYRNFIATYYYTKWAYYIIATKSPAQMIIWRTVKWWYWLNMLQINNQNMQKLLNLGKTVRKHKREYNSELFGFQYKNQGK